MPPDEEAILRVPARLIVESGAILHALGLSADEAVRLFLIQVALHRGLPFAATLPPMRVEDEPANDLLASAEMRQAQLDSFYGDEPGYDAEPR